MRNADPGVQEVIQHFLEQRRVDERRVVAVMMMREQAAPVGDVVLALDAPRPARLGQSREMLGAEGREIVARQVKDRVDVGRC